MEITILGGDERSIRLAYLLENDGHNVKAFGFNRENINPSILSTSLEKSIEGANIVIGPLPLTKDNMLLNTPLYKEEIQLEEIFKILNSNQIFLAGKIPKEVFNMIKAYNIKAIDLMDREEMTVLNGIPTAEGAIQVAMEKMDITLHGANALVLGFGRMGKILSKKLQGLDVNVFVEARNYADIAWIRAYGYTPVNLVDLKDYLKSMDVIFNTIPSMILDENMLINVNKDALIVDIASVPGGVDFKKAEELNIETVWALGLPGKVAPKTAATIIKDTIINIIQELEVV